jgi:hypothetical protein
MGNPTGFAPTRCGAHHIFFRGTKAQLATLANDSG